MNQKVFVNRTLNLKKIKFIGLDMDHTLIRYQTKNFESLVYKMAVAHLVEKNNYPKLIQTLTFNFADAIRGLIIDSKNGNILKLSRYGAIRQSYHGTREIKFREQKEIYRSIYVDLHDPNYIAIDTAFSIAFCVLYSQLIDLKDSSPQDFPSYANIAMDVLAAVDHIHADGSLKSRIQENMAHFVYQDKEVVEGLKRLIRHGKRLFILTNSEYLYTKILLDYAINPFLELGETWRDLFEFVITLANKPRFFYDNLKFLSVHPESGTMTNTRGVLTPGIYQGGSASKFTDDLQLNGDEILYIGDHIYGDILRLKKHCNWRTALVVEELGQEIAAQQRALPIETQIISCMNIKKILEQEYIELHTKSIEESTRDYDIELSEKQQNITKLDSQITKLLQEQRQFFNPHWGRIFRAGAEESYFANQVERFACIYMEKLLDLLETSPITYFRSYHRLLAHDFEI